MESIVLGFFLILVCVCLPIRLLEAEKFDKIALMKGYKGYFKWVFWCGIAGMLIVIALPDRNPERKDTPEILNALHN